MKSLIIDWQETLLQTNLPSNAKYIGMYLRTFMNAKSDIAWPSLRRIEQETGLSRATVCKYLVVLESAGWITRERGSNGVNTRYHAHLPPEIESVKGGLTDGLGGLGVKPRGLAAKPGVVQQTDPNKQVNNQVITNICPFDDFWAIYPRRTHRKPAERAWCKLKPKPDLFETIKNNIAARLGSGEWSDKQFIPHPSTYLNQERWNDEVIAKNGGLHENNLRDYT